MSPSSARCAPSTAVVPSSATDPGVNPNWSFCTVSGVTSLAVSLHVSEVLVNTYTAPESVPLASPLPCPTTIRSPFTATDDPKLSLAAASDAPNSTVSVASAQPLAGFMNT